MSEQHQYQEWMQTRERDWEALCCHCGACCGAFDDPCENLMFRDGKSFCRVYENRLGVQKTIKGEAFACVSIRQKMGTSWPGDERCRYKK
jgi:hypothetical protein